MRVDHAVEVMANLCHVAIEVVEASGAGEVRRTAVQLARSLGFDEVACGRVAIVATELANNLVRHAKGGRMLVGAVDGDEVDGEAMIELLSLDRGPGIGNIAACMADGYSTGGTAGTGLGAVRRLSRDFDVHSSVPAGTVVMARVGAANAAPRPMSARPSAPPYVVGAIRLAAPGERVCGDNWCVSQGEGRASVFVADGLGHGPLAQEASNAAVDSVEANPGRVPSQALDLVHQALRGTRGAAVAMATVDKNAASVTFAGIGNIAGRIISGVGDRSLMSQHGTAGVQIRRVQDVHYELPAHALLVMHSDGIATRWTVDAERSILQCHPAVIAGWLIRDQLRGRDDATVVVLKTQEPR